MLANIFARKRIRARRLMLEQIALIGLSGALGPPSPVLAFVTHVRQTARHAGADLSVFGTVGRALFVLSWWLSMQAKNGGALSPG